MGVDENTSKGGSWSSVVLNLCPWLVVFYARAARYRCSLSRDYVQVVRACAVVLMVIAIAALNTNLAPYFAHALSGMSGAREAYYGFSFLLLATACIAFILDGGTMRLSMPVVVLCALSGLLVFAHPIDQVAKIFLVAMMLCASLAILAACAGQKQVMCFAIVAVAFNAVMCLVDIMVTNCFTNTLGRAAGLAEGPNLAATQLVLGAVIVWRDVPKHLLVPFLLLVGAALIVTLSRSCLIIALMAGAICAVRYRPRIKTLSWRDAAFGVALLCWIVVAQVTNPRFSLAFDAAINTIGRAINEVTHVPMNLDISTSPEAARRELEEIDMRVVTEGQIDSASARSMLMRRAFLRYIMSPWLGVGPEEAHRLIPHNTYLLLALAFGVTGLLVPLGFIWVAGMMAMKTGNWEFPLTIAAIFAVSHDPLLFPSIVIVLAIGLTNAPMRQVR